MLPEFIKKPLRPIRRFLFPTSGETFTKEYVSFALNRRRNLFLAIANFHHINRPMEGYYFEFGSHEANTIRMAWDVFSHFFNWSFVAFDSFEGLPEIHPIDSLPIWVKGKLKTSEEAFIEICAKHGIPGSRLITVKGFYENTLGDPLMQKLPAKAAVIYIDCDLYRSTVPVLEFCRHYLQPGTVIVFDDWNCFRADPSKGERRAWSEFRERYPELRFEDFFDTGMQKAFVAI